MPSIGESIDFSFDAGSATGISVFTQGGPTATIDVIAFGISGSLGTHSVSVSGLGPAIDVSGLFGDAAISHFMMTTTTGAHRAYILNFDPAATVPETGINPWACSPRALRCWSRRGCAARSGKAERRGWYNRAGVW